MRFVNYPRLGVYANFFRCVSGFAFGKNQLLDCNRTNVELQVSPISETLRNADRFALRNITKPENAAHQRGYVAKLQRCSKNIAR